MMYVMPRRGKRLIQAKQKGYLMLVLIDFIKECHFSDPAKVWLFLKKTFLCFFQTYFPSQCASVFL